MKRMGSILVVALLGVLFVLIGCGGGGSANSEPPVINQKVNGVFASAFVTDNPNAGEKVTLNTCQNLVFNASKVSNAIITVGWLDPVSYESLGAEQIPALAKGYGMKVTYVLLLTGNDTVNEQQLAWVSQQKILGNIDVIVVKEFQVTLKADKLIGYINRIKAMGVQVGIIDSPWNLLSGGQVADAADILVALADVYTEDTGLNEAFQTFVVQAYNDIKAKYGAKPVYWISGWPSGGKWSPAATSKNLAAWNQMFASWGKLNSISYFCFIADSDYSLPDRSVGNVEGQLGLMDESFKMKQGVIDLFK